MAWSPLDWSEGWGVCARVRGKATQKWRRGTPRHPQQNTRPPLGCREHEGALLRGAWERGSNLPQELPPKLAKVFLSFCRPTPSGHSTQGCRPPPCRPPCPRMWAHSAAEHARPPSICPLHQPLFCPWGCRPGAPSRPSCPRTFFLALLCGLALGSPLACQRVICRARHTLRTQWGPPACWPPIAQTLVAFRRRQWGHYGDTSWVGEGGGQVYRLPLWGEVGEGRRAGQVQGGQGGEGCFRQPAGEPARARWGPEHGGVPGQGH